MSERDLQPIEVLSKVVDGRMSILAAARALAISTRHLQRLINRIENTGAASIRHKAISRPSNNRIATGVRHHLDRRITVNTATIKNGDRLLEAES